MPACEQLLDAARKAGEIVVDVPALELPRAVGNLCIGGGGDSRYGALDMSRLLIAGLQGGAGRAAP